MYRYLLIVVFYLLSSINTYGQLSNGKVNSLLAAENYFAAYAKDKGIRDAFLKVSDDETILFRPNPVKAEDFFDKKSNEDPGQLDWTPVLAKISKSGDWGFTSGPYSYNSAKDSTTSFGQYLSVWRTNKKGVWKLALDLGVSHPKPITEQSLNFTDPKSFRYFRQLSEGRLKQREDMIMTTDKLFSNTLIDNQNFAYDTFLADEGRLLFPGNEPVTGKTKIKNFLIRQQISIETKPAVANRALGSDLAYSYGSALITQNNVISNFHYVRIWESQEGFKWNVILEIFSPAGE
jgi:ketosteroid isomerase-like protein